MRQRLTVLVLGVLGAVLIALGIASATVWRADDVLVARATAEAGTTLLVTDPGVLSLAGHPVTVTASAPGTVVVAIGRDTDVNGWVGSDRVTHVTGLSSWHTLATASAAPTSVAPTASRPATSSGSSPTASSTASAPAGDASAPTASASAPAAGTAGTTAPGPAPDPAGSDMWIAQATGAGHATLTWPTEQGRWMLLVASTGADAAPPTVQLAWPQTVRTPWLVPGVVAGSLLVVVALWLFLRGLMRSRGGLAVTWNAIETGELVTVGASGSGDGGRGRGTDAPGDAPPAGGDEAGAPLTRRQLRERERTAPVPIVVPKLSLRRRGPDDQTDEPVTEIVAGTAAGAGVPTPAEPATAAPRSWDPIAETPAADRPGALGSPGASGGARSGAVDGSPVEPAPGVAGASANDPDRQDGDAHVDQPVSRRWRRERRAVPPQEPDVAAGTPVTHQTPDVEPAERPGADAAGPVAEAPAVPENPSAGARADAWRRAWGFPGIEGTGTQRDAAPGATTDDTGNGGQQ